MKNPSSYNKIQYIYIILIILWTPVTFIFHVDAMGRIKMLFTFLTLFILCRDHVNGYEQCFRINSVKIMMILIVYMAINYLTFFMPSVDPKPGEKLVKIFNLIYPFIAMTIVIMEIAKGRAQKIFNVVIFSYYLWMLVLLAFMGVSGESMRLNIEGIDSNEYAFVASLIVFLLYIKCSRYGMSISKAIILSILPTVLMVLAGSRTGAGCFAIILFTIFIEQSKRLNAKKVFLMLIALIVLSGGYVYVMENTTLGTRLSNVTKQSQGNEMLETGTALDMLGDRGIFYYLGYQQFEKEPVHGIGLTNFQKKGIYGWNNLFIVIHSEYMVQLAECGLIGFSLLIMFLYSLWRRIKNQKGNKLPVPKATLYSALAMVVLIAFFFWTYDRIYIFIFYGIIIGYTQYSVVSKKIIKSHQTLAI